MHIDIKQYICNLRMSDCIELEGIFNFNKIPLTPPGYKVVINENTYKRRTWAPHGSGGWYIGPDMDNYICNQVYKVRSTINLPGSWNSYFTGNFCAQKINKSQTNRAKIMGI